jgi:nucleotide-binding universal stress UspA family protein
VTAFLIVLVVVLAVAVAVLAWTQFGERFRRPSRTPSPGKRRILFPYVAYALSPKALDAALRLASAEDATLVAVFLARVPLQLPVGAPLPHQCSQAIPLQEAIEQRAAAFNVPVDARIEQGRTYRHALRQTIAHEHFDRIVVSAGANGSPGFDAEDVAWLLDAAPGEIVVLRPSKDEQITPILGRRRRLPRAQHPRRGVARQSRVGARD